MEGYQDTKGIERVIRRLVGRAVADYQMIKPGDHIMLGLSGGKDSVALLWVLNRLRLIAPVQFRLSAATLDQGFGSDFKQLEEFCASLSVPHHVHSVNLAKIIFQDRTGDNPCALCSHLRRGSLNRMAKKLGCNKVAYAHHADDAVETLLLNMFFAGKIASFLPVTYLSRQNLEVIRPLVYVRESLLEKLTVTMGMPVIDSVCPADGRTRRAQVKTLLNSLEREIPGVHPRLLQSLQNVDSLQLWRTAGYDKKTDES